MIKNPPANAGDQGLIPGSGRARIRAWQPTPVSLPGESHGQRSPLGYSPQGHRVRHDWAANTHFPFPSLDSSTGAVIYSCICLLDGCSLPHCFLRSTDLFDEYSLGDLLNEGTPSNELHHKGGKKFYHPKRIFSSPKFQSPSQEKGKAFKQLSWAPSRPGSAVASGCPCHLLFQTSQKMDSFFLSTWIFICHE